MNDAKNVTSRLFSLACTEANRFNPGRINTLFKEYKAPQDDNSAEIRKLNACLVLFKQMAKEIGAGSLKSNGEHQDETMNNMVAMMDKVLKNVTDDKFLSGLNTELHDHKNADLFSRVIHTLKLLCYQVVSLFMTIEKPEYKGTLSAEFWDEHVKNNAQPLQP